MMDKGHENTAWTIFSSIGTSNTVNLQIHENTNRLNVMLTDLSNKRIRSSTYPWAVVGQVLQIPVGGLSAGIYIIRVSDNKTETSERILVH